METTRDRMHQAECKHCLDEARQKTHSYPRELLPLHYSRTALSSSACEGVIEAAGLMRSCVAQIPVQATKLATHGSTTLRRSEALPPHLSRSYQPTSGGYRGTPSPSSFQG